MKTSINGRKIIEEFEGLLLYAYDDFNDHRVMPGDEVHGTLTIGYGHTSAAGPPPVFPGQTITKDEADYILSQDLAKVESQVEQLVRVPMNQNQFDALVSFQFNTGALRHSSALRALNSGNYELAANDLTLYNESKGKVLPDLVKRRQEEKDLFLKEV
jgi:lysozyme